MEHHARFLAIWTPPRGRHPLVRSSSCMNPVWPDPRRSDFPAPHHSSTCEWMWTLIVTLIYINIVCDTWDKGMAMPQCMTYWDMGPRPRGPILKAKPGLRNGHDDSNGSNMFVQKLLQSCSFNMCAIAAMLLCSDFFQLWPKPLSLKGLWCLRVHSPQSSHGQWFMQLVYLEVILSTRSCLV